VEVAHRNGSDRSRRVVRRPDSRHTAFQRIGRVMRSPLHQIYPALAYAVRHLDEDVSLAALAEKAGCSTFHLHRLFAATTGETPKALTTRLRIERAAVLLLISKDSVLDIALSCGFQSHEVFTRAFKRHFGRTPGAYRRRGFLQPVNAEQSKEHGEAVERTGPCVGLYHVTENGRLISNPMSYTVTVVELSSQPVIVGTKRVRRSEIAATIGQVLGLVFQFAQQHGIALTGLPFSRYPEAGAGLITIEPGMRIASSGQQPIQIDPSWVAPGAGESGVRVDSLPAGPAAFTTHAGAYDKLQDAYAALEEWMGAEGFSPAGAPWESYVTDPAEYPNPADWKTEVFWPVKRKA
jgi:AraC family transcriptional regulator